MGNPICMRISPWRRQLATRDGLAVLLAVVVFAYLVIPVYSAVVALSGSVLICLYCFVLGPTKVDLKALVGLGVLAAATAFSAVVYYGDIAFNYPLFFVFPVIYFASSYLGKSSRRLLFRICVVGAALVALVGLVTFSFEAMNDTAWRARAVVGTPNGLGIFLAIAWLCLLTMKDREKERLLFLEPVLLSCLALTLSGGSLLSLACGLAVLLYQQRKKSSWKGVALWATNLAARMVIAFSLGLMFYVAANRTTIPWFCFILVGLVLFVCAMWPKVLALLKDCHWLTNTIVVLCGAAFVVALLSFRQSAFSTFAERIAMMENGLGYLFRYPLYGLGYGQWPLYNFEDADMYFNVAHIHNAVIHIGVEFGLAAMASVVYLIAYRFWKGGQNTPGALAFVVHNLIDVPLFTRMSLFALTVCVSPRRKGVHLDIFEARITLGVFFAACSYCLVRNLCGW